MQLLHDREHVGRQADTARVLPEKEDIVLESRRALGQVVQRAARAPTATTSTWCAVSAASS